MQSRFGICVSASLNRVCTAFIGSKIVCGKIYQFFNFLKTIDFFNLFKLALAMLLQSIYGFEEVSSSGTQPHPERGQPGHSKSNLIKHALIQVALLVYT